MKPDRPFRSSAARLVFVYGTVVLLPLILAYTGYVYWLFRGKVGPGESYH